MKKLFLLIITIFLVIQSNAQLSGTYTIGATGNYTSFSAAVAALTLNGVNGNVVFNVDSGIYNEQITINPIIGTSPIRTITFQSATNNPDDVIINYTATGISDNYVVRLQGADYIRFNNLTFKSLNSTYGRVLEFVGEANINEFSGNKFIGISVGGVAGGTSLTAVIYSYLSNDNNNSIINNEIINGTYGIYLRGISHFVLQQGNIIDNNTITGFSLYGISIYNNKSIVIASNTVNSNSIVNNLCGIYLEYSDNVQNIKKNNISLGGTLQIYGIYVKNCDGIAYNEGNIVNNFISIVQGTYTNYGIYSYDSNYQNYYFNSVNITGGNTSSSSLYHNYGNYVNIENNILSNTGGGYALYEYNGSYVPLCDYNNLYATGTYLAYWQGNRATLNDLKTFSNKNLNSKSVNPNFFSSSNLHINNPLLKWMGTSISGITDDIDGDNRYTSSPDIGADEFGQIVNDGGISSLVSPITACTGTNNVIVKLNNYGTGSLNSVNISWSVNDTVKTTYFWTGALAPQTETSVVIGTHSFYLGTSNIIKAWTSSPNSIIDTNTFNDTLIVSGIQTASLSGIYTIGSSTSADYPSFTSAINALSILGICGPVIFNVDSGTYTEQIIIQEITGASSINTITFQSSSGNKNDVILAYAATNSSTNYVIQMDAGDYFTFKNMSIMANGYNYAHAIVFKNNSHFNKFSDNLIQGKENNYGSSNHIVVYIHDSNSHNNTFFNNIIKYGSCGFRISGNSTASPLKHIVIDSNTIIDFKETGLYLTYNDSCIYRSNTIQHHSSLSTAAFGIDAFRCNNGMRYERNKIILTTNSDCKGIYLDHCEGTALNPAFIANNFIIKIGISTQEPYGIYTYNSDYQNIYYNSVNITGGSSNSSAFYCKYGSNLNVQNNIFSNTGLGYGMYYYWYPDTNNYNSDYNNIYTPNTNFVFYNGNKSTLASYQSSSGFDTNSISIAPGFISPSNLHLSNMNLNATGISVYGIYDDYDGDTRHITTPDIGADEFQANYEVSVEAITPSSDVCNGNHNISATIKNNGAINLISLTINWSINNITQTPVNWTGFLAKDFSTNVTLGSYNFNTNNCSIFIQSSNPNGQPDQWLTNDTLTTNVAVNFIPTISAGNDDSICSGNNLLVSNASGLNYTSLIWSSSGTGTWTNETNIAPLYTPSPADAAAGSVQLIVTAINNTGCGNNTDTMNLIINSQPNVSLSGLLLTYCNNNLADTLIGLPNGGIFSGSGITGNVFNPSTAIPDTFLTILFSYTDSVTGCTSKDSLNTTVIGGFTANLGSDTTICYGNSVMLATSGGPIYFWSTGNTTMSIIVSPSVDSSFAVTVTDINSICSSSDTINVFVDKPSVNLGPDSSIKITNGIVTLDAGAGFTTYLWDDNSPNQTRQIIGSAVGSGIHTYFVDIIDSNGCSASDTIIVEVIDDTGIIKNSFVDEFNFFPNPTSGKVSVDLGKIYKEIELKATNILGQLVLTKSFKTTNQLSFEINESTGVYFVEIKTDEGKSAVFKVMKE